MRLILIVAVIAGTYLYDRYNTAPLTSNNGSPSVSAELQYAIDNQASDVQVAGSGEVIKVLDDDNHGSRHQRFLLELNNSHVILIAHNIDLAPRVPNLARGDRVAFFGEFEWNDKGGVVHWTHHDPGKRHVDGWLEKNGQRYQ